MICTTIGRGRHASLLAEWKAAADAGAELVELRIDCLRSAVSLKRILADRPTPLVFTVRRSRDGGLWREDEEKRILLLREAIAAGVDYVDLEGDIADSIPRFGKTKRIISYHNVTGTPTDLHALVKKMTQQKADVVKFATKVESVTEAVSVLKLAAETTATVPAVGIGMGSIGTFTRVLGAKYGAPITYAGFNPERQFAPGQLRLGELRKDYFHDQIDRETEVYAVIGDPIMQSLSPPMHNAAYRSLGLNKVMVPIQIPGGQLKPSLEQLAWLDLKGLAVTIPHKEAVVPLLTHKDGAVKRTTSCNTVLIEPGEMQGFNTDYRAALDSLEETLGGAKEEGVSPLRDKQVIILGAGGVARSLAFGLARRGAGVMLCNRHDEKATSLAEEVGCRMIDWGLRAGTLADILINCTPVGMHPEVDATPIPPAGFKPGMVAFDTIYHPENTMFLKLARERECLTISGVDMFVRQGALQFHHHTGQEAPVDLMREAVKRKLGPLRE